MRTTLWKSLTGALADLTYETPISPDIPLEFPTGALTYPRTPQQVPWLTPGMPGNPGPPFIMPYIPSPEFVESVNIYM